MLNFNSVKVFDFWRSGERHYANGLVGLIFCNNDLQHLFELPLLVQRTTILLIEVSVLRYDCC